MGTITDLNSLVGLSTGASSGTPENLFWHKEGRVAGAVAAAPIIGRYTTLWEYEGNPSHGVPPTTVAAPTNATAGAWKQTNPGGGRQKWNPMVIGVANSIGTLYLYDRLLHIGNLSGIVTTAQTVGGALTRNTGGIGNEIWAEVYGQIGATTTSITASYTNGGGTAGQITQPVVFGNTGFREAQRMIPLSLAAGDNGVQAVASTTVLATTGTAGNFGIVVLRRLAAVSVASGGFGAIRTFVDGPMNELLTNACLTWIWFPQSTTVPTFDFQMFNVEA